METSELRLRDDLPTGTVGLLLTDIEGSTRLLQSLGSEGYAQALATHHRLMESAFAAEGGVVVDTQGDAFFVGFPDAPSCLRGAVAAQRALARHEWSHRPIRVRMGAHVGEPRLSETGYVGLCIHEAARIAGVAHGGQLLLSDDFSTAIEPALAAEGLTLKNLGDFDLKDLQEPQPLIQVVIPGLPNDFSPPSVKAPNPTNLERPTTPFIGREQMIAALRDLLMEDSVRTVTLTGPGGTGKSRASVRVGQELLSRFKDGVFFVGLAELTDAKSVVPQIAATLGVKEAADTPLADTLGAYLADRNMLLILDNFEQVTRAAKPVSKLLAGAPGLKLLVTSRESLRISGERVFPVPPLEAPREVGRRTTAELLEFEAVALFVDRAQSVRPDFELTEDNAEDVLAIVQQVDALPLALELAAARVRTMEPDRLRGAMSKRLKVLKGGSVDLLDHQRTLRDLISWSFDLLDDDEKTLWQRLSVFVGATFEAAQAVCDLDGDIDVELDVETLVDKSLLRIDHGGAAGLDKVLGDKALPRIQMLHTLRDFALEQLDAEGELEDLQARHRQYYAGWLREREAMLRRADSDKVMGHIDVEQDNLRAALENGLAADDLESATSIATDAWFYWYQRGRLSEARGWLARCTEHDLPALQRAQALLAESGLARQQNLVELGRDKGEEALGIARELDAPELVGAALAQLGTLAQRAGDIELSIELLTEASDRLRDAGNRERLSFALIGLGVGHHISGALEPAAACYQESYDIGQALGDDHAMATALVNLGEVAAQQGNTARAIAQYCRSLELYAELDTQIAIAYCLEILANLLLTRDGAPLAAHLIGGAARIRERLETPVESFNQERFEADVARARAELGDDGFEREYGAGYAEDRRTVVRAAMAVGNTEIGTLQIGMTG
ncbi:MAG: tetratricopeptide repeat protein [Pseudomonadota bacterium]